MNFKLKLEKRRSRYFNDEIDLMHLLLITNLFFSFLLSCFEKKLFSHSFHPSIDKIFYFTSSTLHPHDFQNEKETVLDEKTTNLMIMEKFLTSREKSSHFFCFFPLPESKLDWSISLKKISPVKISFFSSHLSLLNTKNRFKNRK